MILAESLSNTLYKIAYLVYGFIYYWIAQISSTASLLLKYNERRHFQVTYIYDITLRTLHEKLFLPKDCVASKKSVYSRCTDF